MSASLPQAEAEPQPQQQLQPGAPSSHAAAPTATAPYPQQPATPGSEERHELVVDQQRFYVDQFYLDWWKVITSIERSKPWDRRKAAAAAADVLPFFGLRPGKPRAPRPKQPAKRRARNGAAKKNEEPQVTTTSVVTCTVNVTSANETSLIEDAAVNVKAH